jgi:hypothetical protein
MYETFRMLGEQHEADLEREANKRHLAGAARAARPTPRRRRSSAHIWIVLRSRLAGLVR